MISSPYETTVAVVVKASVSGRCYMNDQQAKPCLQDGLSIQERIARVQPYWESLSHAQQMELLTVDIDEALREAKANTTLLAHLPGTARGSPSIMDNVQDACRLHGQQECQER